MDWAKEGNAPHSLKAHPGGGGPTPGPSCLTLPLPANHGPVTPILGDRVHLFLIRLPANLDSPLIALHLVLCGHRLLHTDHNPAPPPKPSGPGISTAPVFKHGKHQGSLRKSSKERVSVQKNVNAFHVPAPRRTATLFFWGLLTHPGGEPAQSWGRVTWDEREKDHRNPRREQKGV